MKVTFFLMLVLLSQTFTGQNEYSQWYFGDHAGLNFLNSPPSPLFNSAMLAQEGSASIADSAGNLLFYTNGSQLWNKMHAPMANGSGLAGGGSTTQSSLIVKKPGSNHLYYVFTLDDTPTTATTPFVYSVVDMSLAAGLGSVVVKNDTLTTHTTEKLCGTMHCNGKDVWILIHKRNTSDFYAYLLTAAGVNTTAVVSSVGSVHSYLPFQMKFSPTGKKLGVMNGSIPGGGVELFDFDNATGQLSSPIMLTTFNGYGIEFSPDGSKLFGVGTYTTMPPGTNILQWDLCAGSPSLIIASQNTVGTSPNGIICGPMQLAMDHKIYICHSPSTIGSSSLSYFGSINNPNMYGTAANFSTFTTPLGVYSNHLSTPNFVSSPLRQKAGLHYSVTSCGNTNFNISTPAYCAGVTYSVNSVLWNFGDPASGNSNTATAPNTNHTFSSNGTYTVQLTVNYDCMSDVVTQTLNISGLPVLSVSGNVTICQNDRLLLNASGANTYSWSNGATTASMSTTASVSGTYTVTGTSSLGCSSTKVVSVTVNPCLGIEDDDQGIKLSMYPNPASNELNIFSSAEGSVDVLNQLGQKLLSQTIRPGQNILQLFSLPAGLYLLDFRNESTFVTQRFVKE